MYKTIIRMAALLLTLTMFGCASSGPTQVSKAETTKQFRFSSVDFKFEQRIKPGIAYHTPDELKAMLNDRVTALLKEKGLLSEDAAMNGLKISVTYQRHFVGDATPFPSDALAYPTFAYKVTVTDHDRVITTAEESDLSYRGGMAMNLKVMAGALRDKKYENEFVDALANTIVERIESL